MHSDRFRPRAPLFPQPVPPHLEPAKSASLFDILLVLDDQQLLEPTILAYLAAFSPSDGTCLRILGSNPEDIQAAVLAILTANGSDPTRIPDIEISEQTPSALPIAIGQSDFIVGNSRHTLPAHSAGIPLVPTMDSSRLQLARKQTLLARYMNPQERDYPIAGSNEHAELRRIAIEVSSALGHRENPEPLLSVITPSFNQGAFIEQTIQSVLAQHILEFEHIVMDGGSSDETVTILRQYPHLKWVSERDRGQSDAISKGFARARGRVICWINSDDWLAPGALLRVMVALQDHAVCMGDCLLTKPDGTPISRVFNQSRSYFDLFKYWIPYSIPAQPGIFFTRAILEQSKTSAGIYLDDRFRYAMDHDLWVRMMQRAEFQRIDHVLSYYRYHESSKSIAEGHLFENDWAMVYDRYVGLDDSTAAVYSYDSTLPAAPQLPGSVKVLSLKPSLPPREQPFPFASNALIVFAGSTAPTIGEAAIRQGIQALKEHRSLGCVLLHPDSLAGELTEADLGSLPVEGMLLLFRGFALDEAWPQIQDASVSALIAQIGRNGWRILPLNALKAATEGSALLPRVSFVVTCYNHGQYLQEAVESVFEQTFTDLEVVIVNDGSTDDSLAVATSLLEVFSTRQIRLLDRPNSGSPAISRNNGIAVARGPYVCCLDADDRVSPNFTQNCVDILDAHPTIGYAYPNQQNFGVRSDFEEHPEFSFKMLTAFNFILNAALFRREAWVTVGGLDPIGYEDWDFWIGCGEAGYFGKLASEAILYYRRTTTGTYSRHRKVDLETKARIVLKHVRLYHPAQIRWAQGVLAGDPDVLALPGNTGIIPNVGDLPLEWSLPAPTPMLPLPAERPAPSKNTIAWHGSAPHGSPLETLDEALCERLVDLGHEVAIAARSGSESLLGPADLHIASTPDAAGNPPTEGHWVLLHAWDFGGLPARGLPVLAQQIDEIWVLSEAARSSYRFNGIPEDRVHVVPLVVDVDCFKPAEAVRRPTQGMPCRFLFLGDGNFQGGLDALLKAYEDAFSATDPVCLVVAQPGDAPAKRQPIAARPDAPEIEYVSAPQSEAALADLFNSCDCLVQPYRAQCHNLTLRQAMACALPIVVPAYGPALECGDAESAIFVPVREKFLGGSGDLTPTPVGYWYGEPDAQALIDQLRWVAANLGQARAIGQEARQRVLRDRVGGDRMTHFLGERLASLQVAKPRRFQASAYFHPHVVPLELGERHGCVLFHHPKWDSPAWREVVIAYARTFTASRDTCLLLWLDPAQGKSLDEANELVISALEASGLDPEGIADISLLPNELDPCELAGLYAAADYVIANGDPLQEERARAIGRAIVGLADFAALASRHSLNPAS
ncbi:MAG: glycosyltransferase [Cyanobacteria bacterium REEB65]|nr:glycosyltransferase [Cyanobacteria bacterium REEB65]